MGRYEEGDDRPMVTSKAVGHRGRTPALHSGDGGEHDLLLHGDMAEQSLRNSP